MICDNEYHTKADCGDFMKENAYKYLDEEIIRIAQDNLNTHSRSSFYSMCLARHNQHLEAHLHAASIGNRMGPIFGAPAIDIDSYLMKCYL